MSEKVTLLRQQERVRKHNDVTLYIPAQSSSLVGQPAWLSGLTAPAVANNGTVPPQTLALAPAPAAPAQAPAAAAAAAAAFVQSPNMAANVILPGEPLVFYTMSPPPVITASLQAPASMIPIMATAPTVNGVAALTSPFIPVSE